MPPEPNGQQFKKALRAGALEGFFGPGLGVFAAMTGFGSLASGAGLSLLTAVALTLGIWSMPGQVAFVDLSAAGANLQTIFFVVTLANVRMLPLTIATMPLLRNSPGVRPLHFLYAQLNSVTSYVRLVDITSAYSLANLRAAYFLFFTLATFLVGGAGTVIGFTLAELLPVTGVQTLIFITPLYLLLLTARSPRLTVLVAVLAGCFFVPLFHFMLGGTGIVIGGVIAGTLAFITGRRRRSNE